MPPDICAGRDPISGGQIDGVLPPGVGLDHTPISDGQSEGVLSPDVNIDHTPVSYGQSEGLPAICSLTLKSTTAIKPPLHYVP